jgi:hypothetical protein
MTDDFFSSKAANAPLEGLQPNPKGRLKEQFHEVARFKQLSHRTEEAYLGWIRRFLEILPETPSPNGLVLAKRVKIRDFHAFAVLTLQKLPFSTISASNCLFLHSKPPRFVIDTGRSVMNSSQSARESGRSVTNTIRSVTKSGRFVLDSSRSIANTIRFVMETSHSLKDSNRSATESIRFASDSSRSVANTIGSVMD